MQILLSIHYTAMIDKGNMILLPIGVPAAMIPILPILTLGEQLWYMYLA